MKQLKQYYFERDYFCEMFKIHAPSFCEFMWEYPFGCNKIDDFAYLRRDDEFYIIHLDSGIMINWYKHLGRTNTCNLPITKDDFIEFLTLLEKNTLAVSK